MALGANVSAVALCTDARRGRVYVGCSDNCLRVYESGSWALERAVPHPEVVSSAELELAAGLRSAPPTA